MRGRAVPDRSDRELAGEHQTEPRDGLTRTMSASNAERGRLAPKHGGELPEGRVRPTDGWFDLYSYVRCAGQSIVAFVAPSALRTACLPSSTPKSQHRSALLVGSQHRLATPPPPLTYTLAPSMDLPGNAYVTAKTRRPDKCPPKQVPNICTRRDCSNSISSATPTLRSLPPHRNDRIPLKQHVF